MKFIQRNFSGEKDRQAMFRLATDFPAENLHLTDLPYRFSSWALDDAQNIRLWHNPEGGWPGR